SKRSRYRVLRGAAVIGETRRHWIRINVRLDREYSLRVRLVGSNGKVTRCAAQLRISTRYRMPGAPQWPGASGASGPRVTISWQPAQPGDGAIMGYRVLRGGAVYAQTRSTSMSLPISSNSS